MLSPLSDLDVADRFGQRIVHRDYEGAWLLLTEAARLIHSPEAMKAAVTAMLTDPSDPIREAQIIREATVAEWPSQRAGDVAVVYVALSGDRFSEAVTLTLSSEHEHILIRDLVWGRP